jgi:hypothetical protein
MNCRCLLSHFGSILTFRPTAGILTGPLGLFHGLDRWRWPPFQPYAYVVWRRIPLPLQILSQLAAVQTDLGLTFYAYMSLILTFGWSLWWAISFISTLYVTNGCDSSGVRRANGFPCVSVFVHFLGRHESFRTLLHGYELERYTCIT